MTAARGVRKVSENIIQDGRALIITEEDASQLKWENIPDGTLKINPQTGMMMVKLEGETDWLPSGLKNDGTLCIIKDSMIIHEMFTITEVPNIVNGQYVTREFTYTNSDGQARHMPITDANELVFEVEKGSFIKSRNHLEVIIDDILLRSPATGGVREINETRFAMTEQLVVGQEITAKYIRIFRIGNPYPRVFMANEEPEASEIGDLWLDMDGTFEENELLGDNDEVNSTVAWNRVIGTPTTIKGYGIVDKLSYEGHPHKKADITDFPASMPANGGNAATVGGYLPGTGANNVLVIQPDGKIPPSVIPGFGGSGAEPIFTVGTVAPSSPVNNRSIWFCTTPGDANIKYYANDKWNVFGASWT